MLRLRDTRVVRVVQKGRHGAREFYNQKMQHCCSDGSAIRLPVRAPFVAAAVPVITCWCIAHSRVPRGRARVRIEYRLLLLQGSSIIFIQRGYCCASAVHTRVAGVSEPSRAPIVVAGPQPTRHSCRFRSTEKQIRSIYACTSSFVLGVK
jgi:hypothetical protein